MVYTDGQIGPIRNAQAADGNGRASVNSPCGGAREFGANGVGQAQDGDTVTLDMRYAAGHNGAFRMAFACGGGDGSALEAADATLTVADNVCISQALITSRCAHALLPVMINRRMISLIARLETRYRRPAQSRARQAATATDRRVARRRKVRIRCRSRARFRFRTTPRPPTAPSASLTSATGAGASTSASTRLRRPCRQRPRPLPG